jgi:hypothetical protein
MRIASRISVKILSAPAVSSAENESPISRKSANASWWSTNALMPANRSDSYCRVDGRLFRLERPNGAALDLIVATTKHFANFAWFRKVTTHGIFDHFVRRAGGSSGKLLQAGFRCGLELTDQSLERSVTGVGRDPRCVVPRTAENRPPGVPYSLAQSTSQSWSFV